MTEAQKLEKKIAKEGKIALALFIFLMAILVGDLVVLIVTCYNVVHTK